MLTPTTYWQATKGILYHREEPAAVRVVDLVQAGLVVVRGVELRQLQPGRPIRWSTGGVLRVRATGRVMRVEARTRHPRMCAE